jgi:hypothetical protein
VSSDGGLRRRGQTAGQHQRRYWRHLVGGVQLTKLGWWKWCRHGVDGPGATGACEAIIKTVCDNLVLTLQDACNAYMMEKRLTIEVAHGYLEMLILLSPAGVQLECVAVVCLLPMSKQQKSE